MEIAHRLQMSNQQVGPPRWCSGKEFCPHERLRFNPWVGRFPGVGNGNSLQYSCLENSRDRWVWWVIVYGVEKESDTTEFTHSSVCDTITHTINRLLINNCKSIHVTYMKYTAFPPVQYPVRHQWCLLDFSYVSKATKVIFSDKPVCFLISVSQWVTSSAIQLYKPEIQKLLDPPLGFYHYI